jgi:hypothetical protein
MHPKIDFIPIIIDFFKNISSNKAEIYNEFSLQHELGIALRNVLPDHKVQFERNIRFFSDRSNEFTKREMDIVIYRDNPRSLDMVIELKYPKNGQYPETMYSFCKDIAFLEELKTIGGFQQAIFIALVDDRLFYEGNPAGIYEHFRNSKPISGKIEKPTGNKNGKFVHIQGEYTVTWKPISDSRKYTMIIINPVDQ